MSDAVPAGGFEYPGFFGRIIRWMVSGYDLEHEQRVRAEAFSWLGSKVSGEDGVIDRNVLLEGFRYQGVRVSMISQQGIFKPRILGLPISITTSPNSPYSDEMGADRLLRYKYRGTDPYHRDNVGLREAMRLGLPLVYFHGLVPGRYLAIWPVYVVGDSMGALEFSVTCEDARMFEPAIGLRDEGEPFGELKREYASTEVQRRIHQGAFRERVLLAYRGQCAFCSLQHRELLDAAHIIPDRELRGEPVVSNGMSLCRLHHAAFDRLMLGVHPNFVIHVRRDILEEVDGPMLRHGLQGLEGQRIVVPSRRVERPDEERLGERWSAFLRGVV